jgi:hypothetical protein
MKMVEFKFSKAEFILQLNIEVNLLHIEYEDGQFCLDYYLVNLFFISGLSLLSLRSERSCVHCSQTPSIYFLPLGWQTITYFIAFEYRKLVLIPSFPYLLIHKWNGS